MLQPKHSIQNVAGDRLAYDLYDTTGNYSPNNTGGYGSPNSLVSYWGQAHLLFTLLGSANQLEQLKQEAAQFFQFSNSMRVDVAAPLADGVYKSELYLGTTRLLVNAVRTTATRISYATPLPADIIQDFAAGYLSRTITTDAKFYEKVKVTALTSTYVDFTPAAIDTLPAVGAPAANLEVVLWTKSESYVLTTHTTILALARKMANSCYCDGRYTHAWSMLQQAEACMRIGDYAGAQSIVNAVTALIG